VSILLGLAQALVVLAVFWVPGLVVVRAIGSRGWLLDAAVAPAITMCVFFLSAWAASRLHIRWTLPLAIACTAALVLAAGATRYRRGPRSLGMRSPGASLLRRSVPTLVVLALAVVAQLAPVWSPILRRGQVPNISDPVFHLNALQYVRRQGVADPATLASLLDPTGATALYPTAWHAVAGVVPVLLDATSLMAAASFVVIAVAWTLGLAALARAVCVRHGRSVVVIAGALSASGMASPLEQALEVGLIPDAVALAVAPGVAALVIGGLRTGRESLALRIALLTIVAGLGLGACHPSALAGVLVLVLPWLAVRAWHSWQEASRARRLALVVLGLGVAVAAILFLARDPLVAHVRTLRTANTVSLGDTLVGLAFGSTWDNVTFAVVVPAFALAAAALRIRRRQQAHVLLSWAGLAALYVLASMDVRWASPLTGLFYGESRRIAPLLGAVTIVLAAEGMDRISRALVSRTELPTGWPSRPVVGAVAGFLVLLTPWQPLEALPGPAAETYGSDVPTTITTAELVPFFTADELAMVSRLPRELGPNAVLFGSARSGVSLVYGIAGVQAFPFARGLPADLLYAGEHMREIASDPRVCGALRAHGISHLYVDTVLWKVHGWPVMKDPFGALPSGSFRFVDRGGSATVYEITACRP